MHHSDEMIEHLAARFAASYHAHQFFIFLPDEMVNLFDDQGELKDGIGRPALAIFAHEYHHYLFNLSTISGAILFVELHEAIKVFSSVLDTNAQCSPERLSSEKRSILSTTWRSVQLIQGDARLPDAPGWVTDATVQAITPNGVVLHEGMPALPEITVVWEITRKNSPSRRVERRLGSVLIEEGVNYLLEEFVSQNLITFAESNSDEVLFYPYRAYRRLCMHLAPQISPLSAVRIGVLALNATTPGAALVDLLKAYNTLRAGGAEDDDVCRQIATESSLRSQAKEVAQAILKKLTRLTLYMKGRGHLESGMQFVMAAFQELMLRRVDDPWFDIAWCSGGPHPDIDALMSLHHKILPCDILQRRPGVDDQFMRDVLLTYTDQGDFHDGLRALQCQMKFFRVHFSPPDGFVTNQESKCPFYTACGLDLRRDDRDTCARRPWKRGALSEACWYGTAVKGTLGPVQIHSKKLGPSKTER